MIATIFGFLPTKTALAIGAMGTINKRVIVPASLETAKFITTKTGLLTKEEANEQEKLFMDYFNPIGNILNDLETEVINIVTGDWSGVIDAIYPTGSTNKQQDEIKTQSNPAQVVQSNTQPIKENVTVTDDDPMRLFYLRRQGLELEGVAKNVDQKLYAALEDKPKESMQMPSTGSIVVPEWKKRSWRA